MSKPNHVLNKSSFDKSHLFRWSLATNHFWGVISHQITIYLLFISCTKFTVGISSVCRRKLLRNAHKQCFHLKIWHEGVTKYPMPIFLCWKKQTHSNKSQTKNLHNHDDTSGSRVANQNCIIRHQPKKNARFLLEKSFKITIDLDQASSHPKWVPFHDPACVSYQMGPLRSLYMEMVPL